MHVCLTNFNLQKVYIQINYKQTIDDTDNWSGINKNTESTVLYLLQIVFNKLLK